MEGPGRRADSLCLWLGPQPAEAVCWWDKATLSGYLQVAQRTHCTSTPNPLNWILSIWRTGRQTLIFEKSLTVRLNTQTVHFTFWQLAGSLYWESRHGLLTDHYKCVYSDRYKCVYFVSFLLLLQFVKRKGWFGLTVSEVSVREWLVILFSLDIWQRTQNHSSYKQELKKCIWRDQNHTIPFQGIPTVTWRPYLPVIPSTMSQ